MGGPPNWPKTGAGRGCAKQSASDTVRFIIWILKFCPIFSTKMDKKLSYSGALSLDPAGGSIPDLHYRLAFRAGHCPPPPLPFLVNSWVCRWAIDEQSALAARSLHVMRFNVNFNPVRSCIYNASVIRVMHLDIIVSWNVRGWRTIINRKTYAYLVINADN